MKTKICKKCGEELPATLEYFYAHLRTKDGLRGSCIGCAHTTGKAYRDSSKGQQVAKEKYKRKKSRPDAIEYFKDQYLWRTYRLRLKDFSKMYLQQKGCCAICKNLVAFDDIYLDHNHRTGKIRELLCPKCNTFVGHIENKPDLIKPIIKYLERHNEQI